MAIMIHVTVPNYSHHNESGHVGGTAGLRKCALVLVSAAIGAACGLTATFSPGA